MSEFSVHEAKAHFSELLKRVEAGETVIVTRHSKPVAELKPVNVVAESRRLGAHEGWFEAPEEAFAPLTDEELKDWFGD